MRFHSTPVLTRSPLTRSLCAAVALAGAAALTAPAIAQTVDEVVVSPRLGPDGRPDRLSRAVSYRDLDLRSYAGQQELKWRIRDTARDLCDELGESRSASGPLMRSCESQAIADTRRQVRFAVAQAYRGPAYASLYEPDPYPYGY